MGGVPPVGYKIEHRQLVVNPDEVKLARHIFDRYLALGNVRCLKTELDRDDIKSPKRKSLTGKSYGGAYFSRGALYWILKNPAYIGQISHKGKIHKGLHKGIIPFNTWERVQLKLKDQTVERTAQTRRRHMLQGLIYDLEGTLYGPVFSRQHDRQCCYYVSQNIKQYRDHPNGIISRLPAHELEMAVIKAIRQKARKLSGEEEGTVLDHIVKHQETIPAYELVRACVEKITIGLNQVTIKINAAGFKKLADKHLKLNMKGCNESFEIVVPFKVGKAKHGAIVIKPEGDNRDIFDLPPPKLKKLVQGVAWRDEHFAGMTLKDIACREKCSEGYVGTAIFESFEFPNAA